MMIIAGKRTRTTEYFTEASNEWIMLSDVPGRVEHISMALQSLKRTFLCFLAKLCLGFFSTFFWPFSAMLWSTGPFKVQSKLESQSLLSFYFKPLNNKSNKKSRSAQPWFKHRSTSSLVWPSKAHHTFLVVSKLSQRSQLILITLGLCHVSYSLLLILYN